MDYHYLAALRREHPAWKLLAAEHAPLVISALNRHFIEPNVRTLARTDIVARLEDDLFRLRDELGDGHFPRSAAQYLDEWASDEKGWLRKYYPPGSDDPHYDITPSTEKVLQWVAQLRERQFVGTESRLLMVFELLRQMTHGTELDPAARIAELEKRKAAIESDIQRVRDGQLLLMDPTQIRDRFLQMSATARELLSDFRDVEHNFRELDRNVREQIASWDESRGALLDTIFEDRDAIENSDQGKSFRAFWDFLMSPDRQEELSSLLKTVMALEPVRSLTPPPDPRLMRIHYDWLEAGEVAQRTVARLSQQLRRYLDDQAWLENRRIMEIIRSVEQRALALRHQFDDAPAMHLDGSAPMLELPMERLLYSPPFRPAITNDTVAAGDEDLPADSLFGHLHVDRTRLLGNIRRGLQLRDQITLVDLVNDNPLDQGLAELVTYFAIAADDASSVIDDSSTHTISWVDGEGVTRQATMPQVIFTRHISVHASS